MKQRSFEEVTLHKEYLDEFLFIYEALKAIFGFEQVSICVH